MDGNEPLQVNRCFLSTGWSHVSSYVYGMIVNPLGSFEIATSWNSVRENAIFLFALTINSKRVLFNDK